MMYAAVSFPTGSCMTRKYTAFSTGPGFCLHFSFSSPISWQSRISSLTTKNTAAISREDSAEIFSGSVRQPGQSGARNSSRGQGRVLTYAFSIRLFRLRATAAEFRAPVPGRLRFLNHSVGQTAEMRCSVYSLVRSHGTVSCAERENR